MDFARLTAILAILIQYITLIIPIVMHINTPHSVSI